MIIALTGLPASGKATVAHYLTNQKGFKELIFSDIIKSELAKNNVQNPVRDDYKKQALQLRQTHGDGALALLLIQKIQESDPEIKNNYVLDGVRTMGEVIEIKNAGGQVWAVVAPVEKRLEWIKSRSRDIDTTFTIEELKMLDEKELHSGEQTQGDHTMAESIKNADVTLVNDKGIEDLEMQVKEFIKV